MEDLTTIIEPSEDMADTKPSIRKIFDAANDSVKSATQIFDKCVALKISFFLIILTLSIKV